MENISLLGGPNSIRLAPVYDPAPMRAWARHNVRSAIPIEFNPKIGSIDNIIELGTLFGYTRADAVELLRQCLIDTESYPKEIMELNKVPMQNREFLFDIVKKEHKLLRNSLSKAT